jgi:hypothetical protein
MNGAANAVTTIAKLGTTLYTIPFAFGKLSEKYEGSQLNIVKYAFAPQY